MGVSFRGAVALTSALLLIAVLPALPNGSEATPPAPPSITSGSASTALDGMATVALPIHASHVTLNWAGAHDATISVAFSADGVTFGDPVEVEHDHAGPDDGRTYTGVIWTGGAGFVRLWADEPIASVDVVAIDAGSTAEVAPFSPAVARAAVQMPQVISRAGWGANESYRFNPDGTQKWPPTFHTVQKFIVHHTAGKNNDPDPAATIRAIYYNQAINRGWGDIGYNFLIDEAGRIYEGRFARVYAKGEIPNGLDTSGKGVQGAHVANRNSGTVGIALLGTLSTVDAKPAARAALEWLLAWGADRHGINPLGTSTYVNPTNGFTTTNPNITGHRDWAATECPGQLFYNTLPALRQAVASRISSSQASVPQAPVLSAASAGSRLGINLTWTVPANGGSPITAYNLYRRNNTGKGSFSQIATVSGSTTSYRDGSAGRNKTYRYIVRAVNAVGVGPASNEATATAR